MKANSSSNTNSKGDTREWITRAVAAEMAAEAARKLARLAKDNYKQARKAFKEARRKAKQARKRAKSAARTFGAVTGRARKPQRKRTKSGGPIKVRGFAAGGDKLASQDAVANQSDGQVGSAEVDLRKA
jgi:hypothetical protein